MSTEPVNPRLHRFVKGTIVSAMITIGAVAFLSVYFYKDLVRVSYMAKICSDDPEQRQRGLNYMARRILNLKEDDPLRRRVLADARRILREGDDACFNAVVHVLHELGAWGRSFDHDAWIRYLTSRLEGRPPGQRVSIAIELGKMIWHGRASKDDPRVVEAVERLLKDEDAGVRLNGLSAAASLTEPHRSDFIESLAGDDVPAIRKHALILLALVDPDRAAKAVGDGEADWAVSFAVDWSAGEPPAAPASPPPGASEAVQELARYESMPTASADIVIRDDMSDLVRLQVIRASKTAEAHELMSVFNSPLTTTRNLACLVALERYDAKTCVALAKTLVVSFSDAHRSAGAILSGMVEPDEKLWELIHTRLGQLTLGWEVRRHYMLTLSMHGRPYVETYRENGEVVEEPFDPVLLLGQREMPRNTVTLALLHQGRLEGLDYFLNPFGESPVELHHFFDALRYWPVVKRYLPDVPDFWLWADEQKQKAQAEVIRDWYLLHRPSLKFDPATHVFRLPSAGS